VDSENDPELASWSTKFHFDTDEMKIGSIKELRQRMKPLKSEVDALDRDLEVSTDWDFVAASCEKI